MDIISVPPYVQNLNRRKELLLDVLSQILHCLGLHNKRKSHFYLLFYNMCMPFSPFLNEKRCKNKKVKNVKEVKKNKRAVNKKNVLKTFVTSMG